MGGFQGSLGALLGGMGQDVQRPLHPVCCGATPGQRDPAVHPHSCRHRDGPPAAHTQLGPVIDGPAVNREMRKLLGRVIPDPGLRPLLIASLASGSEPQTTPHAPPAGGAAGQQQAAAAPGLRAGPGCSERSCFSSAALR